MHIKSNIFYCKLQVCIRIILIKMFIQNIWKLFNKTF